VPGVPFTPLISVAACLYLMVQLPRITWIRFGLWLLVGLAIYFMYGKWHSRLAQREHGP
jgi:APA family basic amino acid/polyamine antiporter